MNGNGNFKCGHHSTGMLHGAECCWLPTFQNSLLVPLFSARRTPHISNVIYERTFL